MEQNILQKYEPTISWISNLYYWLYVKDNQRFSLDSSDLEQQGRIAVWNISKKRPEMLDSRSYVNTAIRYAVIGEIKKMEHRTDQFSREHEEQFLNVKLLEDVDELIYKIQYNKKLSLDEIISTLEKIDRLDLESIKQYTFLEELIANVPKLQKKLKELIYQYKRDGILKIPKRPVISIHLFPLSIKFGYRKYNGSPLVFFKTFPMTYGKMTRSKLSKFDPGLYMALSRDGQLEEAIPKVNELAVKLGQKVGKRNSLSRHKIENIIAVYSVCGRNAWEATKYLPHSYTTVIKHWEKVGLENQKKLIYKLSKDQINEINKAHSTCVGNAAEAVRHLPFNIAKSTILRYWKNAGLDTGYKLLQDKINDIITSYKIYDGNAKETAKHLHHSQSVILRYWKDAGLEIKHRLSPSRINNIIAAYQTYDGNATEAEKHLPHSQATILKCWRNAGLKIRSPGKHD